MIFNFYSSALPEYYWHQGKPHYNWGNKFVHSNLYKKLNPLRQNYDVVHGEYTQMPFYFGHIPQTSWVYGNLDYSFKKYHRHYQAHDDWYPDRKNKTLGHKNGSQTNPNMKQSKFMALQPNYIPKGCFREIQKYLQMLMIDQVNLSIQASRFGWTEDIQKQITNSALLIRKYQRRLRLIRM